MLLLIYAINTVQKIRAARTCKILRTGAIIQGTVDTIRRQNDVSLVLSRCGSRSGALRAAATISASP